LIAFLRALDQLIFLDHRFSSFFEVVYIDRRARGLVGAKAKKFSPHTGGALMRGSPDSAPQSLILPSPPIRFKAGRFSAGKDAVVFRPERFGFSCGVVAIAEIEIAI
jgi:hypothetical protein